MAIDLLSFGTNFLGQLTEEADDRVLGATDTYSVDCSSVTADDGTEISSAWLNQVATLLRTLIRGNGSTISDPTEIVTEDNANAGMLLEAIQYLIQRGLMGVGVDTGTVNALAVTLSPAPPELIDGMKIAVKPANTNTGAATLALLGTNSIVGPTGAVLTGGELVAGYWANLRWNANLGVWQTDRPVPSTNRVIAGSGALTMSAADSSLGFILSAAASLQLPAVSVPYKCKFADLADNFGSFNLVLNAPGSTTFPGGGAQKTLRVNGQVAEVEFYPTSNLWSISQ